MASVAGALGFLTSRTLSQASLPGRISFGWSLRRLRIASGILLLITATAGAGCLLLGPVGEGLSLACLLGVAGMSHGVGWRAACRDAVLSVDELGIWDRRLMQRRISWHEVETFCPVTDRGHVIDLRLRWPEDTLAGTRWPVRIGARLQTRFGAPAVTISTLLLDTDVSELMDAIARYRPDLLDPINRRVPAKHQA
jgi:hypothetical protein